MPVMHLSTTLGDRLRSREDDDGRDAFAGLTLAAVLGCEKRPPPGHVNRTLNDIIREEADGYKEIIDQSPHTKMTWKSFKELLRIRRTGSNWTPSTPIPSSDVPTTGSPLSRRQSTQVPIYTTDPPGPTETSGESPVPRENTLPVESTQDNTLRTLFSRHNSIRALSRQFSQTDSSRLPTGFGPSDGPVMALRLSAALAEERELQRAESAAAAAMGGGGNSDEAEEDEEEEEAAEEEGLAGAPRMSLMALLEETDREVGTVGATYVFDDKDEEEGDRGGIEMEYNCCVCMVRHKGAAFIPCGHTFCRLCSRELWVNRGSCPLCNTFILEILDIF